MTREQKCILAIEKGFTYDAETGIIYGIRGNELTNKKNGYIIISINIGNSKDTQLYGHQFAWYITNNKIVEQIDHINGIKTDNSITNLRSVTNQQNHFNIKSVKGYYKRYNRYISQIMLDGIKIYLGSYDTEEEAHQAYLTAKEKYHLI